MGPAPRRRPHAAGHLRPQDREDDAPAAGHARLRAAPAHPPGREAPAAAKREVRRHLPRAKSAHSRLTGRRPRRRAPRGAPVRPGDTSRRAHLPHAPPHGRHASWRSSRSPPRSARRSWGTATSRRRWTTRTSARLAEAEPLRQLSEALPIDDLVTAQAPARGERETVLGGFGDFCGDRLAASPENRRDPAASCSVLDDPGSRANPHTPRQLVANTTALEGLALARAWGFESPLPHQLGGKLTCLHPFDAGLLRGRRCAPPWA
jgi:hypothetical protein